MNAEMRKHALRRYLVFRVKVIELFDINALWQPLKAGQLPVPNPIGRTQVDFAAALRTIQLSWFAILVDKSTDGMDVIKLWVDLFPKHKTQIQDAWSKIEPHWNIIRTFRDKSGFHADKPLAFFKARREIVAEEKKVMAAVEGFHNLLRLVLKSEAEELPDLECALDELIDELESSSPLRYKRDEFKRYLMIPNTRGDAPKN